MNVFKTLLATAVFTGVTASANAQDNGSNEQSMAVSFGVKGGGNLATINGDIDSPDSRAQAFMQVFLQRFRL